MLRRAVVLPGLGLVPAALGRFRSEIEAAGAEVEVLGPGDDPTAWLGEDVGLIGHGSGAWTALEAASQASVGALVLVAPWPPPGVRWRYRRLALLRMALGGRLQASELDRIGLDRAPPDVRRQVLEARPGLRRVREPRVGAIAPPVLVCCGLHDRVVPWRTARLVGELFDAITWRYDDLGHLPFVEDAGRRLERDVAGWLAAPRRRHVSEVDAFAPGEGTGAESRESRLGEDARRRSAYGRRSGRGPASSRLSRDGSQGPS